MQVHYGFENVKGIRNPVVTLGAFDGVHIGHKSIVSRLNQIAREINGESTLITFYPHPRKVLYPETQGRELRFISTQREKFLLLEKAGVNHLIFVKFTLEFAHTTPEQFVRNLLVNTLGTKAIVVGFNHHFGHNRLGNFQYLHQLSKELGFRVEEIPEQDIHNETVSSTTIRKALREGKIQRANAYLDHQYIIMGAFGVGTHLFSRVNFPTLRVQIEETGKLVPPEGIYAVSLQWNGATYKAMSIIWSEPTPPSDSEREPIIEIHIFNFNKHLPSNDGILYFHKRIELGVDTSNVKALQLQLQECREEIDELIF